MDRQSASPPSDDSEELDTVPVRRVSRGSSVTGSPNRGSFTKPLGPVTELGFEPDQIELQIVADPEEISEIRAGEDVDPQDSESSSRPKPLSSDAASSSSGGVCGLIKKAATDFYQSLLCPEYFLLFNIICVIQAVAALYYYITFFQKGFYAVNSAGMTTVWPATIGSISATIVGSALGPLPEGLITRYFAIAVVIWYYVIALFVFIAAVCLGILGENRAVVWSVLCVLSALASGVFLTWLGLNFNDIKAQHIIKYKPVDPKALEDEIEMNAFRGEEEVTRSSKPGPDSPAKPVSPKKAKEEEVTEAQPLSTTALVIQRAVQTLLWLVLFVFYMIPIGFGIDQAMTAREHFQYPKTGQLYSISAERNSTRVMIDMHMHCTGPTSSGRPTILIEADKGTSGFAYYNLQSLLSGDIYAWRVCTYDRAGYGWSAVSPLGTTLPRNTLSRLEDLLQRSGELDAAQDGQFLLVGHGAGGELMQLFAQAHPALTAGLALLDAYPSDFRLHGLSGKQIKIDSKKICGNYQILRAMDSAAYARPVTDTYMNQADEEGTQFIPHSQLGRYKSTFTNGKYWASLYNDYCMRPVGFTLYTDTLSEMPNSVSSERDSSLTVPIRWPQIEPEVPVLVVAAGKSTDNGKASNVYYQQAVAYNSTLSPTNTSQLVICQDCHQTFPIDKHSSWLAQLIHEHFVAYF